MPATLPTQFSPKTPTEFTDGVVVRTSQFGQGYIQRQLEPVNSTIKTMTLNFFVRSDADKETLVAFLRARATDPLQWQEPGAASAEFYLAKMPFRKTYLSAAGRWEVSCDFEWVRF